MSDKTDSTEKSSPIEFAYKGVTWSVSPLDDRPWQYVPTWNRGEWDEAIKMLIPKQYKKFVEVVKSHKDMNGWFEAYNEAMGGNS